MYEPVYKPVKVTVHFHSKIDILKFSYNEKEYTVTEMISKWQEIQGKKKFSYFTLVCKKDNFLCELQFDHRDLKWIMIHKDTLR